MRFSSWLLFSAAAVIFAGCGQNEDVEKAEAKPAAHVHAEDGDGDHAGHAHAGGHEHGEWWCGEHGIPEHICGQCSTAYANERKKAGDWCNDHHRPASQCFVCRPELKKQFAALYRAKYDGKDPPPIPEEN
ncbi:MAG: RND transporter [Pirellulales bacterium]